MVAAAFEGASSQSAFVRGFIDDAPARHEARVKATMSQSAFVRGFIDDALTDRDAALDKTSQSAFVRGFIDDADHAKKGRWRL